MRHTGFWKKPRQVLMVLALVAPVPARAQVPPFFIPVPASILALPLLLLLIPLGMELSKSDEARVREFEAREDWAGMVALASQRLAGQPGDLNWLELRARALQHQGRFADAIADFRVVFDGQLALAAIPVEPTFAAGLSLGLCEMAVWDLPAATRTMNRLAQLAPQRWEPDYNLGVIRALQGDQDGARAAQASLVLKNLAMADALQSRYIAPASAATSAAQAWQAGGVAMQPPVPLGEGRLVVGNRELVLPPGTWFQAAMSRQTVAGGHIRVGPVKTDRVPVETVSAFALAGEGRLGAVVAFSANPKQAYGITYWNVEEPCDGRTLQDAVAVERFNSPFDQPECLTVRVVGPGTALVSPSLQPALQAAQAAGASLPAASYEIHYARYGMDWVVASTWLLPTQRVAGDLAAIHWGLSLADGLRPLARRSGHQVVTVQPPGPMP